MTVFYYQSFNSNASKTRDAIAALSQSHARSTHDKMASGEILTARKRPAPDDGDASGPPKKVAKLAAPTANGASPTIPVFGPPMRLFMEPAGAMNKGSLTVVQFQSLVQGKAREIHQDVIRSIGAPIDLGVFGEIDGNHSDWNFLKDHFGDLQHAVSTGKACNSFSVYDCAKLKAEIIGSGDGWIAVKKDWINIAFVHVPNAIAKDKARVQQFYRDINQAFMSKGKGGLDVVMGDTNQSSRGFTATAISEALDIPFTNAGDSHEFTTADTHDNLFHGTNSNGKDVYDVAVYNTRSIDFKKFDYISQAATSTNSAVAFTDHMGMAISVMKRIPFV
ncbi:hypothetical protein [Hahella sp. CR1]|uniref:hypothetical protein n=1 Tax=unclassified Hahella TaxID=2624107 RepID=UPI00244314E1|nr:hypothetical protein [Hahella sp. CR1]MDG9669297.1 hypothetical protein [Hahella sp. CR1]